MKTTQSIVKLYLYLNEIQKSFYNKISDQIDLKIQKWNKQNERKFNGL